MKDQRGVVYLETLVAFVPVFLFFLGTLQIADAGAAHLIVKHAATVAARAAVVVLPDDGVYYNDKDNAQIHQFTGLRRDDIEHAADLVLGANARLDGTSDNVSIGFSAPPIPTPPGETKAEQSRSFGERLLDTSNRGQGEQNMRELVTAQVDAKYTCLVAALCPRDLNMVGQASLVYQGARYIYEARTNGARNAAHSHNTNGGLVNAADQNRDPDPDAADRGTPPAQDPDSPIANAPPPGDGRTPPSNAPLPSSQPPGTNNGARPGTQNPSNGANANASNANTLNPSNANASNVNTSSPSNASASNANTSIPPNANASNANTSTPSNASASNANASNPSNAGASNANTSNPSNASASNANAANISEPSAGNSNTSNPSNASASNPNTSNPSNASASNSAASNGARPGAGNATPSNRPTGNPSANTPNASKPQIIARPRANDPGSTTASTPPASKPNGTANTGSTASPANKGTKGNGTTPSASSDQHREVAAAVPPPKRDDPRPPVASRTEGPLSAQADTSRPGRGSASPRGPPSTQSVVAGTNKGDSSSRTVNGRTSPGDTRPANSPSTVLASAASRPTRDPSVLGVDSQGRTQLVVTNSACFVAGTQIQTAHGAKRIEAIAAGDRVLAFDVATHTTIERPVLHSFTRKTQALIDLEVEIAGETSLITGTPEHPFFVPERDTYVPLGDLTPGTTLTTHSGASAHVRATTLRNGDFDVFNFQVAEHHNYFVAAASGNAPGVLVHNAACNGTRPSPGDETSPREPVSNSTLARQPINGNAGPHEVFQVGDSWREPLPAYRGRDPSEIPTDGYRDYRMVEVVDGDGHVIAQREERYVQPARGRPYWTQRGSASTEAGARMERASDKLNQDLIASRKIVAAFNTQNASGQGFDGVTLSYDGENNPRVNLVEVKDYPGRYIPLADLSAVNKNLKKNLDALRLQVQDEDAAETLGLTPEQLDLVRQALDNNNVGIEIRPGPTTLVGAPDPNLASDADPRRVVDALQKQLDNLKLTGGVTTRTIPQSVVDRTPGNKAIGTQPRFYQLARGPNKKITHDGVHRANQQLAREATN